MLTSAAHARWEHEQEQEQEQEEEQVKEGVYSFIADRDSGCSLILALFILSVELCTEDSLRATHGCCC